MMRLHRIRRDERRSGERDGCSRQAAPGDAVIHILATLRDDAGNAVAGLERDQVWHGEAYPPDRFAADAGLLDGVRLLGSGSVSDMIGARPALAEALFLQD